MGSCELRRAWELYGFRIQAFIASVPKNMLEVLHWLQQRTCERQDHNSLSARVADSVQKLRKGAPALTQKKQGLSFSAVLPCLPMRKTTHRARTPTEDVKFEEGWILFGDGEGNSP